MAAGHVSDECDAGNKTVAFGLNQPSNIATRAAELAIRGFIAPAFQIAGARAFSRLRLSNTLC
jgi:hypothetical protein